jgi:urea transport system permease protein
LKLWSPASAGGFAAQAEAVDRLGALGDPRAVPILRALSEGRLQKSPEGVLAIDGRDALTGAPAPTATEAIRINNRVRGALRGAFGRLELASSNEAERAAAAAGLFRARSPENIAILEDALGREASPAVRAVMERALAASRLAAPDVGVRRQGIIMLGGTASPEARGLLLEARAASPDLAGLSLGSVLLLAAIGLAITFGVMGVINMAHGEMVMLGAYTTFVVQEVIRTPLPRPVRLFAGDRAAAGLPGRRLSASRSSAASSASSTAGRWKRCSRPGASVADPAAGGAHRSSARPTARSAPELDVRRLRPRRARHHL